MTPITTAGSKRTWLVLTWKKHRTTENQFWNQQVSRILQAFTYYGIWQTPVYLSVNYNVYARWLWHFLPMLGKTDVFRCCQNIRTLLKHISELLTYRLLTLPNLFSDRGLIHVRIWNPWCNTVQYFIGKQWEASYLLHKRQTKK